MQSGLLRAKLHRPVPATGAIPRNRLLRRLQAGLTGKVTLVSAAAGAGKTTILSAWLDQLTTQPPARPDALEITANWLTLDQTDNQLPRFLRYLVATIEENFPRSCAAVTALLQANLDTTIEALADALTNGLALLPNQLVLVLDDLHLLNDTAIYALLTRLIQHTPPTLHLILSTRVDPPLPLHRWRAQGWLNELRLQELFFTVEETALFLEKNSTSPPPAELVATLHKYTEGWPVGVRLAALALRGHADLAGFLANVVANSDRYVIDYLRDDVLDQQPAVIQHFLICTAMLKQFCPALCAAVLEVEEGEAQQQLSYVERTNLFLVDLSAPSLWYRYHHQFQGMLLSKLHERYDHAFITALYGRAATWLEAHGEIYEALLYLTKIADFGAAADLLERRRIELMNEHRLDELAEALALIPLPLLNSRPVLLITLAWTYYRRFEQSRCAAVLARVEQLLAQQLHSLAEPTRQILQLELVVLGSVGERSLTDAQLLARIDEAWTNVQPHLAHIHNQLATTLAERCQRLGAVKMGLAILDAALERADEWTPQARGSLLNSRGLIQFWDCNLVAAERDFQVNLCEAQRYGFVTNASLCQLVLGVLASARHQLASAEVYLEGVMTDLFVEHGRFAVLSLKRLIELYALRGVPNCVRPWLERLRTFAETSGVSFLHDYIAALDAYLALHCGDLPQALRWALAGAHVSLRSSMYGVADRIPLIRITILMTDGSPTNLHLANQLISQLIDIHESQHLHYYSGEAYICQTLTWAGLGQSELALSALGEAVQRLVPNGAVGLFIQQGQPMRQLLYKLRNQPQHTNLVDRLLTAFPVDHPAPIPPVLDAIMALTDRELDVLRLLVGRLSNKEIATRLVVSTNTVRNHMANIFSKLQVENRFQAIERARTLGLLADMY